MEENGSPFRYDYDLERLTAITPRGRDFQMLITPRFIEHYYEKPFEGFSCELLLHHMREGMLFVDVGAHYGYYTLLVGTACPGCRIIALEPVPENHAVLERNVALNGLANVETHNLAVSDCEGWRKFKIKEASDSCGFHDHPLTRTVREIEVRTTRLDAFLDLPPAAPVFIKIDTDGHEPFVIRGMKGLLEKNAEVKLLVEFNPKCLRKAGYEPERFLEEISALGFEMHAVDERNGMTYRVAEDRFDRWSEYLPGGDEMAYINLLCLKKERSLSVCFFSHSSDLGGAERSLLELVSELVEDHGALCTVVIPGNGPLPEKMARAGASVVKAGYSWWWKPEAMPPARKEALYVDSAGEVAYLIERALRKVDPDVIATFTTLIPWGAFAASLLGKPHAWFVRELGDRGQPLKAPLPPDETARFIEQSSSAIVVNSHFIRKELFPDDGNGKVLTVYSRVEIPAGALEGHEGTCFEREGATRLMVAGAVYEQKGQRDAVLAVRELVHCGRDVELAIMGHCVSEYAANLKKMVEEEGLEKYVKFVAFRENPYPFLDQADIVLSCGRHEAFGRSIIEGMLLKKPVIATSAGGTLELVRDGFNGLLYAPGDHRRLAAHIAYLADNPEEARRLGENGFAFASRTFTREEYGGRIYGLLRRLKDERAGETPQAAFARDGKTFFEALRRVAAAGDPLITSLVIKLGSSLAEKERRIAELTDSLHAGEERIAELHARIGELNAQVGQLDYDLEVRVEQIVERDMRIAALENIIRHMEGRMVIRLAGRYQRAVDRLLPTGTWRRRCHDLLMKGLRTLVNEGWRAFGRRHG
ncbi:MAG: FkbM family methyltransferase [Actinobacteria bacterium]|nr:FkbM family methyltransferase [Actinomycetota bacterium]